jgi:hypothetical protein
MKTPKAIKIISTLIAIPIFMIGFILYVIPQQKMRKQK